MNHSQRRRDSRMKAAARLGRNARTELDGVRALLKSAEDRATLAEQRSAEQLSRERESARSLVEHSAAELTASQASNAALIAKIGKLLASDVEAKPLRARLHKRTAELEAAHTQIHILKERLRLEERTELHQQHPKLLEREELTEKLQKSASLIEYMIGLLKWMSDAPSFQPDGPFYEKWAKDVEPLLAKLGRITNEAEAESNG